MFGKITAPINFNKYIVRENCDNLKAGDLVLSNSKLGSTKNIRVTTQAQDKIVWCPTDNLISIFDLFKQNKKSEFTAIGFKSSFKEGQPYWLMDIKRVYSRSYCKPYRFDSAGEAIYFIKHHTRFTMRNIIITKWDFKCQND